MSTTSAVLLRGDGGFAIIESAPVEWVLAEGVESEREEWVSREGKELEPEESAADHQAPFVPLAARRAQCKARHRPLP